MQTLLLRNAVFILSENAYTKTTDNILYVKNINVIYFLKHHATIYTIIPF